MIKIAGLLAVTMLSFLLPAFCSRDTAETSSPLVVYCGAGINKAASEIGSLYEKKTGVPILYNFAGSNTLLSQLQLVNNADIYIPAASYYLDIASQKGLVENRINIARHVPVIAVPKGNPKAVTCLEDLGKEGIRICLGDPKAAAIGKTAVAILEKNKLLEKVSKNIVTQTATVNEAVVFLGLRQVDAAIIWEDNALSAKKKIDMILIPFQQNCLETIPAGITTSCKRKKEAGDFIAFWKSPEAERILIRFGFPLHEAPAPGI
ncbi:MAG: molybdate ABC transporter substrate-binding protein [bacterium]|nr:molybdate ABC transporter substrate-binding protein [bacterium]